MPPAGEYVLHRPGGNRGLGTGGYAIRPYGREAHFFTLPSIAAPTGFGAFTAAAAGIAGWRTRDARYLRRVWVTEAGGESGARHGRPCRPPLWGWCI